MRLRYRERRTMGFFDNIGQRVAFRREHVVDGRGHELRTDEVGEFVITAMTLAVIGERGFNVLATGNGILCYEGQPPEDADSVTLEVTNGSGNVFRDSYTKVKP